DRLRELLELLRRVNPTGRGRSAREERARYAEKARLQSLLIEDYPLEVRVRAHDDMPGVVSLAVPRLGASAAHAVVEALSARARAWVEESLEAGASEPSSRRPRERAAAAPETPGEAALARAARRLEEYDFECAEADLAGLLRDSAATPTERRRALTLLLELYVDRLANDAAALTLEPTLRSLEPVPESAHELLGVAAQRAGAFEAALRHLGRCSAERAAEALAACATAAADAGAWEHARKAWALLLAFGPPGGEPAPSNHVRALREGARGRLSTRASAASEQELEADASLVRFVKEFAPEHPWLDERRQGERALRAEASSRVLLERAEALAERGELAGVERALAALARLESATDEAGRAEALRSRAKQRRAEALAERALAAAAAGAFEEAGRTFLALHPGARGRVLAEGGPLFATLEALGAAAPERPAARTVVAAAAWIRAQSVAEATERWRLLGPHAALLESVPAFADELRAIRPVAPPAPRSSARSSRPPLPPAGPREFWSAGLRLIEVDAAEPGATEIVSVSARALREGTSTFIVTLEREPEQDGIYDLVLRPTASRGAIRRIRFEGAPGWRPRGPFVTGGRMVVVDEQGVARSIAAWPDLDASSFVLADFVESPAGGACALVGDGLLALENATGGGQARWALFDAATGEARGQIGGPRLCLVPSAEGTTFYRVSGASIERLDAAGDTTGRFELPRGISPLAVVESPLGDAPVVLAPWPVALVTEPSGRRGWAVRRDEAGGVHLDPLNLRVDDA
ncbi:MAG: hypothetical protein MUF34_37460, partial [Polyangiaceae bacterium]|nr:hypothetical protein [Polyangiaceae bacterium]